MLCELEEQRELAANRLTELERLQRQHEGKVAECAKLSMQVSYLGLILFKWQKSSKIFCTIDMELCMYTLWYRDSLWYNMVNSL